jgi:hypothetical protein
MISSPFSSLAATIEIFSMYEGRLVFKPGDEGALDGNDTGGQVGERGVAGTVVTGESASGVSVIGNLEGLLVIGDDEGISVIGDDEGL